jgi:hypothetical protein
MDKLLVALTSTVVICTILYFTIEKKEKEK